MYIIHIHMMKLYCTLSLCSLWLQKGDTPLHIAIRGRSRRLAELLLRNPKDGRLLYRPNKAGETPYNIDCSHQKSILTQIFGARKSGTRLEVNYWLTLIIRNGYQYRFPYSITFWFSNSRFSSDFNSVWFHSDSFGFILSLIQFDSILIHLCFFHNVHICLHIK